MTKKRAKQIIEKYNPADEVIRCPNGRAHVKKLLDTYARAAVNTVGKGSLRAGGPRLRQTRATDMFLSREL